MHFTRRQFVHSLLAGSANFAFPSFAIAETRPWSKFPSTAIGKRLIIGGRNRVHFIDSDTLEYHGNVYLDIHPHSFLLSPRRPNELWAIPRFLKKMDADGKPIEKGTKEYDARKSKAVAVDLTSGEVVREIIAPEGSDFRGHAYFVPGTDIMFISGLNVDSHKGYLTGYDTSNGQEVEKFYAADATPHEAKYMPDDTVIYATAGVRFADDYLKDKKILHIPLRSGEAQSGIHRIDAKSGKLISFSPIEGREQAVGHMEPLPDGRFIAVSRSKLMDTEKYGFPGGIYIGKEGETLQPLEFTLDTGGRPLITSEMFSIAIDTKVSTAFISDYMNGCILSVDIPNVKINKQIRNDGQGVVYNRKEDNYIAYGKKVEKYNVMLNHTMTAPRKTLVEGHYFGSHGVIL